MFLGTLQRDVSRKRLEQVKCIAVQNLEFLSKQSGFLSLSDFLPFVCPIQIQCLALYWLIKALLLKLFLFQNINISLAAHEVKCTWYLHSPPHPPSHFLTSGYLLQTHDNSNCFWFPLKLSRVDCQCKWLLTYDDLIVKMIKFRGSISTYTCSGSLSTWFLVGLESATVSATPHKSSYFYCLT